MGRTVTRSRDSRAGNSCSTRRVAVAAASSADDWVSGPFLAVRRLAHLGGPICRGRGLAFVRSIYVSGPEPTKRSQLEHPPPEERATPSNMAFSACVSEV